MKLKISTVIRYMAGEGNYYLLRNKSFLDRVILSIKLIIKVCLMVSFRERTTYLKRAEDVIYVSGSNQKRLVDSLDLISYGVNENSAIIEQPKLSFFDYKKDRNKLISIKLKELILLSIFCVGYALTGSNKLMAKFLVRYYFAISEFLDRTISGAERIICFNDQPFEAAALILWAKNRDKSTVVIQHGVILSFEYYFPMNADEFWGWGDFGRRYFKSRSKNGKFLVKGRNLRHTIVVPEKTITPASEIIRGVVCPSFFWAEIFEFIKLAKIIDNKNVRICFKLHPSTKAKFIFRIIVFHSGHCWIDPKKAIHEVALNNDFLLTRNSSSAVDFFLLGKPVFGFKTPEVHDVVFNRSFFDIDDLRRFISEDKFLEAERKNRNRVVFLNSVLGEKIKKSKTL